MSVAESFESCPAKHKNAVVYKVNMRILNVYRINLNRRCKKMEKIRIGIVGYGNIGRGVEQFSQGEILSVFPFRRKVLL